jgi:hypothetical protein
MLVLLPTAPSHAANALAGHPSPYLAMHAGDPVDWRDWGAAALAEARAGNRPLLISSGYFACHWCHVMQRESWQDDAIAALLNDRFIPVKVDRELYPALDEYLIHIAEQARGQAGWPLNVFLTPAGHPLYAALYLPPEQMRTLLERLAAAWDADAENLAGIARRAARERAEQARPPAAPLTLSAPDRDRIRQRLVERALALGDPMSGGFGHQSRFPRAPQLAVLLELVAGEADPSDPDMRDLAALLRLTLDEMAGQGFRDLIGGGFFRYTVDPNWQVPHFEKMLYTQALLVPLYLHAATVFDEPGYRDVARDTLDFMLASMTARDGLMIASLSAVDADGVEGGHYLWMPADLARLLTPAQRAAVALAWGLDGPPELKAGLLPRWQGDPAAIAARHALDPAVLRADLSAARTALLAARAERPLPRDDKVLAGWNGLALSGLAAGVGQLGDDRYAAAGQRLRDALIDAFFDGEDLHRTRRGAATAGCASAADYAYVARGLADWAAAAGDPQDLALARALARRALARFRRDGLWQREAEPLLPDIPGVLAWSDAPLPAPDAVLLDLLSADPLREVREQARRVLAASATAIMADPFDKSMAAMLLFRTRVRDEPAGAGDPRLD